MLRSIRLWAVGALSLVSVTSLWAQCVPPAGPYRMWIDPANQSAVACPGNTITFDIVVSGGAQSISGAGFNIEIGVPGTITSVVPGFNPAGGGFITHVDPTGTKLAGFAIRSPTVAPLTTVATVTYALQSVSTPGTFQILFNGTLALPGGTDVVALQFAVGVGALQSEEEVPRGGVGHDAPQRVEAAVEVRVVRVPVPGVAERDVAGRG